MSEAGGVKRTSAECLEKFHEISAPKTRTRATAAGKGKKAGKSAEDDSPATLEGFNMGTNKRRRKMRQLLEKAETGYTDDVFQAKGNDTSMSFINISEDEWQPTKTIATPSKSPVGQLQSGLLEKRERDKFDAYIGRFARKQRRPKRRGKAGGASASEDEDSEEAKDSDQDAEEAAAPAAAAQDAEGDEEVELSEEARVRLRNLRNKVVVDEPLNKRQKRMHQMQEVAGKVKELLTTETRKDDVFNDDESILVNNNSTNSLDATADASD